MSILAGGVALAIVVVVALVGLNHPRTSVASCLVGTWAVTLQQVNNTIDGQPVQFTGDNGWTVVINSAGQATENWTNSQLTAAVDGVNWEEIVNGAASYDVKSSGNQLSFSHQSVSGSYKLLEDGILNTSGKLQLQKGNSTYSCSGSSLRETSADGASAFVRTS